MLGIDELDEEPVQYELTDYERGVRDAIEGLVGYFQNEDGLTVISWHGDPDPLSDEEMSDFIMSTAHDLLGARHAALWN